MLLHRQIDTFTDAHPVFRASKHRLSPIYNLFSGILVDMFYDHFLARNFSKFSDLPLDTFAEKFYVNLNRHASELNEKTLYLMPYMIQQNWLYHYKDMDHLERILEQMERRISHPSHLHLAIHELTTFYSEFETEFFLFFEELQIFAFQKKEELILAFH